VESRVTLATRASRSDAQSGPQWPGCWRSPWLPAARLRPLESGPPSDRRANPRIRRPLRKRFAVLIETPRAIGFSGRRDSLIAWSLRLGATAGQLPEPHQSPAIGDRTSARRARSIASVQSDPMAAFNWRSQRECHNRSVSESRRNPSTLHFLPYLPTLRFALFAFMEASCAP
jgi:hypothetical protein